MKYLALAFGAITVFVLSLLAVLAATGNLNQDTLDRLMGKEISAPEAAPSEEPIDPMVQRMRKREQDVAAKERELKEYEAQLDRRAAELDTLYQQIQSAQQALDASLGEAEEARQAEILTVANTLSNMKPKAAAERIQNMPVDEIVDVLRKIEDKERGKIVQELPPDTAAELFRKMQDPRLPQ